MIFFSLSVPVRTVIYSRNGQLYLLFYVSVPLQSVFWIRIRIHMFLGLPDPEPLVRGIDPDPDPEQDSIIMQK